MKLKLTKAKAIQLARRELGTSNGLAQMEGMPKGWFSMRHGNLEAEISPVEVDRKGYIGISLRLGDGYPHTEMLYDGETLEPDIEALDKYRMEE